MKVIWSPLSNDRVQEISEYISNDSSGEAFKCINEIFEFVLNLENFPEIGRNVPEIKKTNYRELIFGNYRIVYRKGEKQVYILTVRHFKQILPINELKKKKGNLNFAIERPKLSLRAKQSNLAFHFEIASSLRSSPFSRSFSCNS